MDRIIGLLILLSTLHLNILAQDQRVRWLQGGREKIVNYTDTIHNSKVYIVSGSLGFGFPMGKTKEVLTTRLASSWGMDISLPNRHYVLYPSVDFWNFGYNQRNFENNSSYLVENGRARLLNVNLPIGVRRQWRHLNTYITGGPSVGLLYEPRIQLIEASNIVRQDFDIRAIMGARVSAGADYKFKGFFLYVDAGWMHSFAKIQDRPLNILSFYVGLKTDITGVANRVATILEKNISRDSTKTVIEEKETTIDENNNRQTIEKKKTINKN